MPSGRAGLGFMFIQLNRIHLCLQDGPEDLDPEALEARVKEKAQQREEKAKIAAEKARLKAEKKKLRCAPRTHLPASSWPLFRQECRA